ncbi:MAG: hypothetical protein ACLQHF_16405 [Terracidiphilus sp.]
MPNITVTVSQAVYTDARVFAAQKNTSVSAIVKLCLQNLSNLRLNADAASAIARNRQADETAAKDRELARRAARMAAFQAEAKSLLRLKTERPDKKGSEAVNHS